MGGCKTYAEQQNIKYAQKINELLKIFPEFCREYFNSLEYSKQPRTRLAYARDLKTFFEFLIAEFPQYSNYQISDFTLHDIESVTGQDISDYLRYMKVYDNDGTTVNNDERAAKRKLCSLRRFYGYYYRYELISNNPSLKVDMPKIHDKAITRLDVNEVAELLDNVENGNKLTTAQLRTHEKLKCRDLALLTLLLGTGIRVSECVGLDYMEERKQMNPDSGHENALFISSKNKRLCVRSVELLVKKYASTVTTVKHITPHKLRSTYGTNLYQASKDIYLVADVLGHKDVNTTRKHYAEIVDENKRSARNIVRLRTEADD